jgi:hypothetical protein
MNVTGVTLASYEGGIEFADLNSVKNTNRLGFDSGPAGGIGLAMKMIIDDRHESRFMQDLLGAVDRVTEERGMHKSYDYDGVGPFFKTTVEVQKVKLGKKQFVYLLSLNAAYVGDQPCAGLATSLGADRALWRDEVVIELAPNGDRFEVDFDVVADRLARVGFNGWTGRQIADHIMAEAPKGYDAKTSVALRDDDLKVTFGIQSYSVQGPVDYQTHELVWAQSGSVISGPLERGYDGEQYSKPRLYASVSVPEPENTRSWDRKPVLDPTVKQAIHQQAAAIVGAFQ